MCCIGAADIPSSPPLKSTINEQRAAISFGVLAFKLEQSEPFWETVKSEADPTDHSIFLKGVVVHNLNSINESALCVALE